MKPEAYIIGYDSRNTKEQIRDNLLYYLGEYRLGVKFAEFFYEAKKNPLTGETYLTKGELGPIRERYRRAIKAREEEGLSVRREVAECLGFEKLEKTLVNAPEKALFIWVSPPGPKEEGYGPYSFTFIGQLIKGENGKKVRVIPYRNILSREEHKNYLGCFTKEAENFTTETDFLAHPVVFPQNEKFKVPEDILTFIGEHERFSVDWMERLKQSLGSLIQAYIEVVKKGASDEELLQALWALENYTIAIKDGILNEGWVSKAALGQTVPYLFEKWGKQAPPTVAGSCGASASTLMEFHNSTLAPDKYGSRTFVCPECGKVNIRPKDELLFNCQHCNSNKVAC